jgi:hypothetical protein
MVNQRIAGRWEFVQGVGIKTDCFTKLKLLLTQTIQIGPPQFNPAVLSSRQNMKKLMRMKPIARTNFNFLATHSPPLAANE